MCNEKENEKVVRETLIISPIENGWIVCEEHVFGKQFCFTSQSSLAEFIRDYYA